MHYPSLNVYTTPIINPVQQQPAQQQQQPVFKAKSASDVIAEHAMALDTPAKSVGFLEHF